MAKVNFKRIEDSGNIDNIEIEDGSFIITGDGKTYVDYGDDRIPTSGTPDTEMSDMSRNTVENNVIKNYVDNKVNDVNGKILWANPNPTSAFTPQIITLNSNDYDVLEIFFKVSTSATSTKSYSTRFLKGYGTQLINVINLNEGVSQPTGARSRDVDYVNDTKLHFKNGLVRDNGTQTSVPDVRNDILIPLYIVGYKTGLFD